LPVTISEVKSPLPTEQNRIFDNAHRTAGFCVNMRSELLCVEISKYGDEFCVSLRYYG